jgi:hypothetical protein
LLYRVIYGHDPPAIPSYTADSTRIPAVHQQLKERDEFLADVRDRLEQAQQHYKAQYDAKHREVVF